MKPNGSLMIYNLFPIAINSSSYEINVPFNDKITESIRQGMAIAASDASVKDNYIGGYWIIANVQGRKLLQNTLYYQ